MSESTGNESTSSSQLPSRRWAAVITFVFHYGNLLLNVVYHIALVPFFLQHFTLGTYGAWLASVNILRLVGALEGGMPVVTAQRLAHAHGEGDRARFARYAISALAIYAGITLIVIAAGAAMAPVVPLLIDVAAEERQALVIAVAVGAIGSGLTMLQEMILTLPRSWQRPLVPGIIRLGATVIRAGVTVVALFGGLGVVALGAGFAAAGAIGALVAAIYVAASWRRAIGVSPRPKRSETLDLLVTSAWLLVSRFSSVVLGQSEALVVATLLDPRIAAVLALTSRLFEVGRSIATPIGIAVYSSLAHLLGQRGPNKIAPVLREIFAISVVLTAIAVPTALAVNRYFVAVWVGPDNYGGDLLSFLIAVNAALMIRLNLLGAVAPAVGEIRAASWCSVFELGARLPLMLLLLPLVGVVGMPLAGIASGAGVSLWYLHKLMRRGLDLDRWHALRIQLVGVGGLSVAFVVAVLALNISLPVSSWSSFVLYSLVVSTVVVGAALLGGVEAVRLSASALRQRRRSRTV